MGCVPRLPTQKKKNGNHPQHVQGTKTNSSRDHVLFAAAATALIGLFASERVKAADLVGDCCADLEARIAELGATTVRKGDKKVAITLYGQTNKSHPLLG